MGRRRELSGIVHGLLGSFNSRNNDIEGYWGIGVLCLYAKNNKMSEVKFDLMHCESTAEMPPVSLSVARYHQMLDHFLEIRGLQSKWVKSAELSVCFDAPFEHKLHYFGPALGGKPYICTLEIMDDLGHKYSGRNGGNCWPHNAEKERRSNRWNGGRPL